MVKGLDKFKTFFKDFSNSYIIIGGTACHVQFEELSIGFRATSDIDMLLIIEPLNSDFVKRFWEFIKEGKYDITQVEEKKRNYYRFADPVEDNFPVLIELFSRLPDVIQEIEGMHLTPIPLDDDLSSLSAILMDVDYYNFTFENAQVIDNLSLASIESLILLKIIAFLNLSKLKNDGENIDSKNIKKHKNDILRLAAALTAGSKIECSEKIKIDVRSYINTIKEEKPNVTNMFKEMGLKDIKIEDLIEQLQSTFLNE